MSRPGLVQRLLRDSAYCLTALPIGILTFVIAVTGLSAGAGLLIVAGSGCRCSSARSCVPARSRTSSGSGCGRWRGARPRIRRT